MTPSQTATGDKELNVQNLADSLFRSSSHRAINKAEELFNTLRNNCQDATSIQLDEFAQLAEKQTMEWIEAGWTETKARLSKYVQSWLRSEAKDPPREGSHSSGGKVCRMFSVFTILSLTLDLRFRENEAFRIQHLTQSDRRIRLSENDQILGEPINTSVHQRRKAAKSYAQSLATVAFKSTRSVPEVFQKSRL